MSNKMRIDRRRCLMLGIGALALSTAPRTAFAAETHDLVVYKSPSCGCCGAWADIVRQSGFSLDVRNVDDLAPIKKQARVPEDLEACHTSIFGSYVVEGHVPVEALMKLRAEMPGIHGIAVPGMPAGSPGMGYDPAARYDVIGFGLNDPDGRALFLRMGAS